MKRRHFVRALVAAPVAPALMAQQGVTPPPQAGPGAAATMEIPKLEVATADQASEAMPKFFTPAQFAALRKLCDVLMPATDSAPGALSVGAPEFLDFLVGESPGEKQQVYRAGLDALNAASRKKFAKAFSEVDGSQADAVLAPLHAAWTYEEPSDALAKFLRAARTDVRTATMNSKEYSAAASTGGRRGGGTGLYWYPLD